MKNAKYIIDEHGNKISLVVSMEFFKENSLEDLYDIGLAEYRLEKDEFVEFDHD